MKNKNINCVCGLSRIGIKKKNETRLNLGNDRNGQGEFSEARTLKQLSS